MRSRVNNIVRAFLLIVIGLAINALDLAAYDILVYFGLMFVLIAPVVRLRSHPLLTIGTAMIIVLPVLRYLLHQQFDGVGRYPNPMVSTIVFDPLGVLATLGVTGGLTGDDVDWSHLHRDGSGKAPPSAYESPAPSCRHWRVDCSVCIDGLGSPRQPLQWLRSHHGCLPECQRARGAQLHGLWPCWTTANGGHWVAGGCRTTNQYAVLLGDRCWLLSAVHRHFHHDRTVAETVGSDGRQGSNADDSLCQPPDLLDRGT